MDTLKDYLQSLDRGQWDDVEQLADELFEDDDE